MKKFWLGFAVVFLAVSVVYLPSLLHLFRGETYIYFLNTQGHNSFWDLIANSYNYEKVRIYEPGDTLLFRPLLFTIIGGEKAFFGSNYILWHTFAIALHLVATFCLFRLLWKWRKGWLAVLVSVLFATSYMIINTVLYEQVVPYMAFTALVLTALYYLDDKPFVSFVCMAVGVFIYEMALPFVVLMAVYLWYKKQKDWAWVIASVILIYFAVYIPEKFINPSPMMSGDAGALFTLQGIVDGLSSALVLAETWLLEIVFPSAFTLIPLPQLIYYPAQIHAVGFGVFLIINLIALIILADPLIEYVKKLWKKKSGIEPFVVLLLGMLVAVLLAVSLFRAGSRGMGYTVNHSFGSYAVVALVLCLIFYMIKDKVFSIKQYSLVAVGILAFIGLSATTTFNANYQIMQLNKQPQDMTIKTWSGSPESPVWYETTIPKIMAGVK